MQVFGILAKVEMESPLHEDKCGVRGGQKFSQQEKGCFPLKAVWGKGKTTGFSQTDESLKKSRDKCKGLCLKFEQLVIWP